VKPPASTPSGGRGLRLSLIVAVLAMLAPFSIDAFLPSFPDIAQEFGAADWQMQQTLSLYLLAFGATTLVYGPLSDAFGRRRVILASLAFYTVSSIGCALASSIHTLLLTRIGQGLSASAAIVIGRAIVRDVFQGAHAQRVMAQVMLLFGAAPAIAPILGGYLHEAYGWRSVFWFLAGLAVFLWMWTAVMLPETLSTAGRQTAHPRAVANAYWRALRHLPFVLLVVCFGLNFSGLFLYVAGSPTILYAHLGLGAEQFGYFFVPVVAGLMLGAFTSGRLAGRYTHARAVWLGYAIMFVAAVVNLAISAWVKPTLLNLVGPVSLYAVGMALAMPNISLLALDCLPDRRGLSAAVQSFVQMVFLALTAGLVVPLLAERLASMAAGMLALVLVSAALWISYVMHPPVRVHHGPAAP
jgi:MFS transporter, DHA1 family, multidrug resistance protein